MDALVYIVKVHITLTQLDLIFYSLDHRFLMG
jgi:hypothetical protein